MIEHISSKSLIKKVIDSATKAKEIESKIKREEKLLEDEIYEMSKYIKTKLSLGLDIFRIQLPDTAFDLKKIIFFILNKNQRKQSDNIVLRQYLVSNPEFIDTLKLREQISDPKELLLKISQYLKKEEIYKDKVIFYNGQLGKSFYLILEGEVSILLPYEYKIKITDKQLFKYMSFLLEHKEYELIRLILESNSMMLNENDYRENELYIKFKSVIDKALPVYMETEKISSFDYIKRYNFFKDIENKSIFVKINKIKENNKKEEKEEMEKESIDKNIQKLKNKKDNKNLNKNEIKKATNKNNKKENDKNENEKENEENAETPRKDGNFFYNMERTFTVWKYFEVVRLSKGKCFGELALQKEGKKRNATIITTQNSIFGILQKDVYQMFIKETMDKARKVNVELLLKSKLFKGCNLEKFESHYFNCFKFMKKYKGEYLFKQGEQRDFIYFIKKGEVQIELFSTCFNIDKIVENLGYPDENLDIKELIKSQKKIEQFCNVTRKFNVLIFSGDAVGLNDHIISDENEELIFSGICVTYCELFALDKKFFNKMMDDKIIKNNFNKMVKERKERLSERLLLLRYNIILQHYNFIKGNSENNKYILNNNYYDNEGNIINKKKEFKKCLNQDNIEDTRYINNNNINNNSDEIINKIYFNKKKNVQNFNRTIGTFHLQNNINKDKDKDKNNKIGNLLNIENNFNATNKRLNTKSKTTRKYSIKALDMQDNLSRNLRFIIKEEKNKTNEDNIKINMDKIQNEGIAKEIKKFSSFYNKKNNKRRAMSIEPRYSEVQKITEKNKNSKNDYQKLKIKKNNISTNKLNNLDNFINFGNIKLKKLLLKQSIIYNTEIDKIDKIIINNFDKISPLSCKLLTNKESPKKKNFEENNTVPNLDLKQILNKKDKYSIINRERKKGNYISYKSDNKLNNFSLPIVLSKNNKNNRIKIDSQIVCSKGTEII